MASAKQLLAELHGDGGRPGRRLAMEAYVQMAARGEELEAACRRLQAAAAEEDGVGAPVPVLLALATAFMHKRETPKARNQLKKLYKMGYRPEEAEEFERAWLMMAELQLTVGKYDLAQEAARRCLLYNKSCGRAWELSGQIFEREQSYRDAAEHYESAWRLDAQSSPALGFRLAFNFLKAKRHVDAIDVCLHVLKKNPTYPRIRKEILDKARASIRP